MHIPDPDASRLVVIGAGLTDDPSLPELPSVRRGAVALHELLTDSPAALFHADRTGSLLIDPDDAAVLIAVGEAANRATDTLIVYYAGHGVLIEDKLHLVMHSAGLGVGGPRGLIPWWSVVTALAGSRARYKAVILDCAYGGRTVVEIERAEWSTGRGRLSSTLGLATMSEDCRANAPSEAEFPVLTGRLVSLLREGRADGAGYFVFDRTLHHHLQDFEVSDGGPSVVTFDTGGTSMELAFARNIAHEGPPSDRAAPPPIRRPRVPQWTVPGFAGEVSTGPDLLGISEDTLALAVLISSRALQPPLALGLFGDWGSGKTFFMRRLESDIRRLTSETVVHRYGPAGEPLEPAFCRRVVSVWFNAWHYAEANLWASLIHHIFDSLNGHADAPEQLLEEAMEQIHGIQETRAAAVADTRTAEHLAEEARLAVVRISDEHREARDAAAGLRARDLLSGLRVDGPALAAFNEASRAVGLAPVGAGAQEVAAAVAETRELADSTRRLSTAGPWYRTPLFLGLGTAAVLTTGGFLASALIDWSTGWAAAATAAGAQAVGLCSGAVAWVRRQTGLARTLLGPATALQRQLDARLAELAASQEEEAGAAQERLDLATAELASAREALARARERERAARDALARLTGERLLERYLADRVASADYGRYLGVVALAHRDLRDLESFLRKAAAEDGGGIDRIVLYIDDLDRCPPKVVATVLEAVHLLLALPLFVVVVGVDSRWLSRSLLDQHPLLLSGPDPQGAAGGHADPADYLDKIFQLSYTLPAMTRESSVELLRQTALAGQPDDTAAAEPASVGPAAAVSPSSDTAPGAVAAPAQADFRGFAEVTLAAAALALTPEDLRLLEVVAPLVGSSPRRAKRFLNLYRVMKARSVGEAAPHDPALMVVTALVVGFPTVVPAALAAAEEATPIREWLETAVRGQADPARVDGFLAGLTGVPDVGTLTVAALRQHLPLVRRFAWPVPILPSP